MKENALDYLGRDVSETKNKLSGPCFTQGVDVATILDGSTLLGSARGEPVLLARRGDNLFAISAACTHNGAPVVDSLLVGNTLSCPWHHAGFRLDVGKPVRAPALDPVAVWRVEQVHDAAGQFTPIEQKASTVHVREKLQPAQREPAATPDASLRSVVIAAGLGVKPNLALVREAGLAIDRGLAADAYLQTSLAGIYAAGDIARWPDRLTDESIRVDHGVVAETRNFAAAGSERLFHDFAVTGP